MTLNIMLAMNINMPVKNSVRLLVSVFSFGPCCIDNRFWEVLYPSNVLFTLQLSCKNASL